MTTGAATTHRVRPELVALMLGSGFAVALSLGLYARLHSPARKPIFLLGFSGVLQMKAWVSSVALLFVLVQLATAVWMWQQAAPRWLPDVHRWSGSIGFALTLPVAFHCIWSLGYVTTSARVLVHSTAGCLFYGAYATKMIGLRVRGLPGWALPALGGSVLTLFLTVWLTSALWLFTRHGIPLT
jgi:hypothetical protein